MKKRKYENYKKHKQKLIDLYLDDPLQTRNSLGAKFLSLIDPERAKKTKDLSGGLRRFVRATIEGLPVDISDSEFQKVKETKNGQGETLFETHRRQTKKFNDVPANHEIVRISTNKSLGQQWIITQPKKHAPEEEDFDSLAEMEKQLKGFSPERSFQKPRTEKSGVIKLTDFHFGAYISALKLTPEFNISILCDMLERAADQLNWYGYKVAHIHILGDLIESFTGLNHKNSWKGLDKGMFGVSAIKLFVELFSKHFLERVHNLGEVKIVAGNHDRVTSDSKEDVDGGAAELVAWGLEKSGYNIEFSSTVLTHIVDGICHILNHGHLYLTKRKTTEEICWMYGEKGMFNFITEGHLHSRIAKLSATQIKKFHMISDDTVDTRRQVCPSLFTGNMYSESGGWSSNAGFLICETGVKKKINVFDYAV